MEATRKTFSIDSEPQTLNSEQMQQVKEAILYLLNNKSSEEAQKFFAETSENAQENFTEGVNPEPQETQEKKTDAMGVDDTNLVQKVENEKIEAVGCDDNMDFEEEFDYSSSDDDSMVPTLVIDPERDVFSAPF